MEPVPFHVPTIEDADIPGVLEVLRSGWITTGARAKEFEAQFAAYVAEESGEDVHALAVSSGTAALHLALEASGIGPGDRVLVPVWTFTATAEVVRYLGADPVFCDVDGDTLNLDVRSVTRALEALDRAEAESIKAVMPVHVAGLACDMEALEELACTHHWSVIDDAAHSLPTRHRGRRIGRWGRASAFSFYATKTLCTGEGGMVVTRDADMAARMRVMRLHGINRDAFDRYRSEKPAWYYEIVAPGYKYNMGDIAAALGLSQLERIDRFRDARAAIAARYCDAFEGVDGLIAPLDAADAGDEHAWHLYTLKVEGGRAVRDRLIEELSDAKIGTSVHFIPLHMHPYWRDRYHLSEDDFPEATKAFGQEVSLPIFPAMTDGQIQRVCDEVPRAYERAHAAVSTSKS